jgi:hypothetical protein
VFNVDEQKVAELAMVPNVRGGKEQKGEESRSARTVAVREGWKVAGPASLLGLATAFLDMAIGCKAGDEGRREANRPLDWTRCIHRI